MGGLGCSSSDDGCGDRRVGAAELEDMRVRVQVWNQF